MKFLEAKTKTLFFYPNFCRGFGILPETFLRHVSQSHAVEREQLHNFL